MYLVFQCAFNSDAADSPIRTCGTLTWKREKLFLRGRVFSPDDKSAFKRPRSQIPYPWSPFKGTLPPTDVDDARKTTLEFMLVYVIVAVIVIVTVGGGGAGNRRRQSFRCVGY